MKVFAFFLRYSLLEFGIFCNLFGFFIFLNYKNSGRTLIEKLPDGPGGERYYFGWPFKFYESAVIWGGEMRPENLDIKKFNFDTFGPKLDFYYLFINLFFFFISLFIFFLILRYIKFKINEKKFPKGDV